MSASSISSSPRSILRSILRNLRTNVPLVGGDSSLPTRSFVLKKARTSTTHKITPGNDYAQLLQDLKERQRLLTIDRGADMKLSPKEMTRRAAARAGLAPPKLDPNLK